jgi:hypothetical protein
MRNIRIDSEVFEHLTTLADPGEAPSDVIARLLARAAGTKPTSSTPSPTSQARPRRQGTLKPLIDSGAFVPGDELRITWPRYGRELTVAIDEEGKLHTEDGQVFTSPSDAGFSVTGKTGSASARFWTHLRSGRTLDWWKKHHANRDDRQVEARSVEGADTYLTDPFRNQGGTGSR